MSFMQEGVRIIMRALHSLKNTMGTKYVGLDSRLSWRTHWKKQTKRTRAGLGRAE